MGFVTQGGDAGNLAKASVRSLSTQAAAEAQQLERGADGGPGLTSSLQKPNTASSSL